MDKLIKLILTKKLLEACSCNADYSAYALFPEISEGDYSYEVNSHSLLYLPKHLEFADSVFSPQTNGNQNYLHQHRYSLELKDKLLAQLSKYKPWLGEKELELSGDDEVSAALSLLFSSYLDCFVKPIQFYVPLSSSCAGQWDFWDKQDYFLFLKNSADKSKLPKLVGKLSKNQIWKTKLKPEDFNMAVRKALLQRQMFDKSLEPEAMIKAIIIRMGELSNPAVRYETIDYAMRSLFASLKVNKYLRVDREIEFLKRLEKMIKEEISFI
ncbi:MAG: hypothetical protein AABX05_04210 [Nanoarchaeota archaeon]